MADAKEKDCGVSWFEGLVLFLSIIIVSLIIVAVTQRYQIANFENENEEIEKLLTCYECTWFPNRNMTLLPEMRLPEESECESSPRNVRQCGEGEQCLIGVIVEKELKRFFRKCHLSKVIPGCYDLKKPLTGKTCICDTSRCLQ